MSYDIYCLLIIEVTPINWTKTKLWHVFLCVIERETTSCTKPFWKGEVMITRENRNKREHVWSPIPEQKRVNAYNSTDTHMTTYYYCKGYWCWHFQREMLLLLFLPVLHEPRLYQNIIAEIFLPSNLLSIERTNANAHISMNFVLREGCAALYYTLPFLSSLEWYIWLSYMG